VTSGSGGEALAAQHGRCGGSAALMRLSWLWCRLRRDARAAPGLDTPSESPRQCLSGRMAATALMSLFPVGGIILVLQPVYMWSQGETRPVSGRAMVALLASYPS
jgi:hypothetical protein